MILFQANCVVCFTVRYLSNDFLLTAHRTGGALQPRDFPCSDPLRFFLIIAGKMKTGPLGPALISSVYAFAFLLARHWLTTMIKIQTNNPRTQIGPATLTADFANAPESSFGVEYFTGVIATVLSFISRSE